MSPAGVDSSRDRAPLRWFDRVSVRSCGSAPIAAVSSASISSCIPRFEQPAEQLLGVAVTQAREQVGNSGIIVMGHRVVSFSVSAFAGLTKGHAMAHPPVDPSPTYTTSRDANDPGHGDRCREELQAATEAVRKRASANAPNAGPARVG